MTSRPSCHLKFAWKKQGDSSYEFSVFYVIWTFCFCLQIFDFFYQRNLNIGLLLMILICHLFSSQQLCIPVAWILRGGIKQTPWFSWEIWLVFHILCLKRRKCIGNWFMHSSFIYPVQILHFVTSSESLVFQFERSKRAPFETSWQILVVNFRVLKDAKFFKCFEKWTAF